MADASQPLPRRRCVLVCQHRSCLRSGAAVVLQEFRSIATPNVLVSPSDCLGQCGAGPMVRVMPDDSWYCRVKLDDVETIATEHLQADRPVARLLHPRFHPHPESFKPS